jgi:hypothetical protein
LSLVNAQRKAFHNSRLPTPGSPINIGYSSFCGSGFVKHVHLISLSNNGIKRSFFCLAGNISPEVIETGVLDLAAGAFRAEPGRDFSSSNPSSSSCRS